MALSKKQMSVDDYSVALTSVVHNPLFSGDDDIDPQPMGFGNPTYATLREDEEPGGMLIDLYLHCFSVRA